MQVGVRAKGEGEFVTTLAAGYHVWRRRLTDTVKNVAPIAESEATATQAPRLPDNKKKPSDAAEDKGCTACELIYREWIQQPAGRVRVCTGAHLC